MPDSTGTDTMRRVFAPRWMRWVFTPLMVLLWVWITYEEYRGVAQGELGLVGYAVLTVILLGLAVVLWLMGSGKLPAYYIEE